MPVSEAFREETMKITRRIAIIVTAGVLMAGTVPTLAADAIKLRISTPAVESDWHAKMLPVFKDELEKLAPGQFDVEIHLNATLFKQGTEPAAMQRGNLDMAMISAQDIAKQIPEWSVFTAGYLIRDPDHQKKVFRGEIGKEFYGMVKDQMGIQILDVGYLGTRQLNLRGDKKIGTPDDLSGVKLRMPGSDAWQFLGSALGASPVSIAFGEIYTALQTGVADGQDNPLPTDKAAKFYEVTNQIVLTNHLVDAIFLSISSKTWDKLSGDQKAKVAEAAQKAIAYNDENRIKDEAELIEFFKGQGLSVYEPNREAFRKRVQSAYQSSEFAKSWPTGILDKINAVK